jgi:hypothetical protein
MTELLLYIVGVVLLLAATALLLRRPRAGVAGTGAPPLMAAEFFPVHCRYFPQVRHALSPEDSAYLARRGLPAVHRRWKKSQRRASRLYLAGLREDFSRLNRLARLLALYSPQVRARQELELAWLNLQFQLLYGIVVCRFLLGRPAVGSFGRMAALIGSLGSRLEQAALSLDVGSGALTP